LQRYIKIFYQKVKINFFIRKLLFIFAEIKYETMEAKEKAKELVEKYKEFTEDNHAERYCNAKQCALIAADEILKSTGAVDWIGEKYINFKTFFDYWEEVKQEILKL
jgi:hypothetical protein